VRSVLRRTEAAKAPGDVIRSGDVELDVPSMENEDRRPANRVNSDRISVLATMRGSRAVFSAELNC